MKYKNIHAAIHNLGHSFLSLMNYVDGVYVVDDLADIIIKGHDIEIDWLSNTFAPQQEATPAIIKSLDYYCTGLKKQLQSEDVDVDCLKSLKLYCPVRGRKYMRAEDDRGKDYKIYIS